MRKQLNRLLVCRRGMQHARILQGSRECGVFPGPVRQQFRTARKTGDDHHPPAGSDLNHRQLPRSPDRLYV